MNTDRKRTLVKLLLLAGLSTAFLALSPVMASGQEPSPAARSTVSPASVALATDQFVLVTTPKKFIVQATASGKQRQIAVPREWLVPPKEEKKEEQNYVSSFNYDERITSFPIGNGQIGLQISSWDEMKEGSAQAAVGRDAFLIFDPKSRHVKQGGIKLGITKERVRSEGCFSALAHTFYLADINEDGLIDIGVIIERMKCIRLEKKDVDTMAGPFYYQEPIRWYLFKKDRWNHDPPLDGLIVSARQQLPLIGIEMTPVEFVKQRSPRIKKEKPQ